MPCVGGQRGSRSPWTGEATAGRHQSSCEGSPPPGMRPGGFRAPGTRRLHCEVRPERAFSGNDAPRVPSASGGVHREVSRRRCFRGRRLPRGILGPTPFKEDVVALGLLPQSGFGAPCGASKSREIGWDNAPKGTREVDGLWRPPAPGFRPVPGAAAPRLRRGSAPPGSAASTVRSGRSAPPSGTLRPGYRPLRAACPGRSHSGAGVDLPGVI